MLGESQSRAIDDLDVGHTLGKGEGGLQRLGEPLFHPLFADETIDHDLDGVLVVAVEADLLGQLPDLTIDPGPGEPLLGQIGEEGLVFALPPAHHRRQHLEASAFLQLEDAVDDLLRSLSLHRGAVVGTVGDPDPGVEESQVVVDLGDRAHRGPGVARRRLLVDRDRRGQPVDEVDVGLVHLTEELAGIGGERLDIATLAFCVDGVEGERGLAGTGEPGEDDQLVARKFEREVLEVVLTGTPDEYRVGGQRSAWCLKLRPL